MELFKKNPNETAYPNGAKPFCSVIKNSGSGDLLIWRQPEEDFNTNSTLIVMPGEKAIFVKNGIVQEKFEPGSYTLNTENYPFISRLRNIYTGGISAFNCVVYFVRDAVSKEIKWGTPNRIDVRDKAWKIATSFGSNGAFKFKIVNPVLFLQKLVGNNAPLQTQEGINDYVHDELQSIIISQISQFLNSLQSELIGLSAFINEISEKIEPLIDSKLKEYGLSCVDFSIAVLDPDLTKYDQIDESQITLIARQRGYEGDKLGFEILKSDWARVHAFKVIDNISQNPGAGGVAAAGAGIGMGIGMTSVIPGLIETAFGGSTDNGGNTQSSGYNDPYSSGRFVQQEAETGNYTPYDQQNVGTNNVPSSTFNGEEINNRLKWLKHAYDEQLITEEEYKQSKSEIMKLFGQI